ncbi:sulfotransferase domain-containing protein, partial [Ardenticatena maritima]
RKIVARVSNKNIPKIIVISVPKAGTHLIERVLCLHPNLYRPFVRTVHSKNLESYGGLDTLLRRLKPGHVLITHLHYTEAFYDMLRNTNVKPIVVIRDPRDIVVSRAFYVVRNRKHYYYPYAKDLTLEKRLYHAIIGDTKRGYPSMKQTLEWFEGWLNTEFPISRFEEFVDPEQRLCLIENLFAYLGLTLTQHQIASISEQIISSASPTFRKGATGEWRKYLQGDLYNLFLETCGDLMQRYGYE